ncbi:hypothetical protein Tco_0461032 [Tanacetum coccineum]
MVVSYKEDQLRKVRRFVALFVEKKELRKSFAGQRPSSNLFREIYWSIFLDGLHLLRSQMFSMLISALTLDIHSQLATHIVDLDLIQVSYRLQKVVQIRYQGPTSGISAFRRTLERRITKEPQTKTPPKFFTNCLQPARMIFSQHLSDEKSNHEDAIMDTGAAT